MMHDFPIRGREAFSVGEMPIVPSLIVAWVIIAAVAFSGIRRMSRVTSDALRVLQDMPAGSPSMRCGFRARVPWRVYASFPLGRLTISASALVLTSQFGSIAVARLGVEKVQYLGPGLWFHQLIVRAVPHPIRIYVHRNDISRLLEWLVKHVSVGGGRRYLLVGLTVMLFGACAQASDKTLEGAPGTELSPEEAELPVAPWSVAIAAALAPAGEYRQTLTQRRTWRTTIIEQWVRYDLTKPLVEHTVALYVDPSGEAVHDVSRERPTQRFIYTDTTVYMWQVDFEARCGAPWLELSPSEISASAGRSVDQSDFFDLQPFDMIRNAPVDPGLVETDDVGSHYEIAAAASAGIEGFIPVDNPELFERLASDSRTADVRVPHNRGILRITIDQTESMAEVMQATGRPSIDQRDRYEASWFINLRPGMIDISVPQDVSPPGSCDPIPPYDD